MHIVIERFLGFLLMSTVILVSCSSGNSRMDGTKDGPEVPKTIAKNYERCVGENCVTVDLAFPRYEGSDSLGIAMNSQIEEFLSVALTWGEDGLFFEDFEAAIDHFMASFEVAETDGYNGMDWMIELNGTEVFRSSDLITLKFTTFYFTGGAHPNSTHVLLTFDLDHGGIRLKNEDLILDREALAIRGMEAFRVHHDVQEGVSLEEDGRFFLENGTFFLPQAMGYSEGDFVLLFNPYEIGPYVMGITEIGIPLSELNGVVRQPVFR
ncbi:MAG: DUF4163 domain-containing protein [Lunatimonas sp.]|uniref:DUF3298 and DUF4163 domain-containing protein n=1 Tax=Lunatimonas sp. TaxID=2060141 RepID=UPI00263A8687|nr:DUF3298 and DUF4163 domain-containing protein [Lunatimonas sp.]MCC5938562.1 DUF4163 domain-containing protein [Lunatimonas sp.]